MLVFGLCTCYPVFSYLRGNIAKTMNLTKNLSQFVCLGHISPEVKWPKVTRSWKEERNGQFWQPGNYRKRSSSARKRNKNRRGFIARKRKGVGRLLDSIWKFWMQRFSWRTCTVRSAGAKVERRRYNLWGGSEDMFRSNKFLKLDSLNAISFVPWTGSG